MKTQSVKRLLAKQQAGRSVALVAMITAISPVGCLTAARAALPGIGLTGCSYSDEYYPLPWADAYGGDTTARVWVQQLAVSHGPDSDRPEMEFGSFEYNGNVRSTPRYSGYEYNWARTGTSGKRVICPRIPDPAGPESGRIARNSLPGRVFFAHPPPCNPFPKET